MARTQGSAGGYLTLPYVGSDQKQNRDIAAGDEQQQSHSANEDPQTGFYITYYNISKQLHTNSYLMIGARELQRQPLT
jgi:hypothetical protein